MRARKHSLPLSLAAFIILLATSLVCPAFADNWQLYTAPHGDFKLMMPAEVTAKEQNLGGDPKKSVTAMNYTAIGSQTKACVIACELQNKKEIFEKFAEGAKNGITGRGATITQEKEISGPGWSGILYDYSKNGETDASMLVAKVDDSGIYYTIAVNSRSDAKEGKSMFSSFEVDPQKATSPGHEFVDKYGKGGTSDSADDKASSASSSSESESGGSSKKSEAYEQGKKVGEALGIVILVVIGFLVLTVPIGIVILVVYLMKQRDKRG